jgi:RND superfamily putative drug exporter
MPTIARWCFRHRFIVVGLWVAALILVSALATTLGTKYNDSFSLPGTDSSKALSLLKSGSLHAQSGDVDTIVIHRSDGPVTDPTVQAQVSAMLAKVAGLPAVGSVRSPYTAEDTGQISADQKTAFASVTFTKLGQDLTVAEIQPVVDVGKTVRSATLQVEFGGNSIERLDGSPVSSSEAIGLVAAAIVLFIAFGSLFSMAIPLVSAIFALGTAIETIGLMSRVITIGSVAPTIAALVGLGVGIDYALFIVTRFRSGLRAGLPPERAAVTALNTAGRAVLFAGATVAIAMMGLLILGVSFLTGIGIAAAVMVLFAVAAATTLLPAIFGVLGMRTLSRRERRQLADRGAINVDASGFWARWAGLVQRKPLLLSVIATGVMLALVIPAFSIRLGSSDQGNNPSSSTTRKAYDLLADGFGPGYNGPLQLVAQVPKPSDQAALTKLVSTLRATPGVASVAAPPAASSGATIQVLRVTPDWAPQSAKTSQLIDRLRHDVIPPIESGTSLRVYVGGQTAIFKDFGQVLTHKLPLFIAVVVLLGCLLLLLAFRSLLIPLTAAVMNLLAAGASFGVVVAVFQWGWGSEALGVGKAGPVESFLPVMMLAILFGLSMDYQVFLVSRMHEEWIVTGENKRAVRIGQAATGRVITAAAAIMVCVFLAFVLGGQRVVAEFGLGLATAILLDALILRTVLVPAAMQLFGPANWWIPAWLDRILPHVSVEGAATETDSTDDPRDDPRAGRDDELVPTG